MNTTVRSLVFSFPVFGQFVDVEVDAYRDFPGHGVSVLCRVGGCAFGEQKPLWACGCPRSLLEALIVGEDSEFVPEKPNEVTAIDNKMSPALV
jgi:hypothetical protein